MCANIVNEHMNLATNYLINKKYLVKKDVMDLVKDTFETIKTVVKEKLNSIPNTTFLEKYLQVKVLSLKSIF